MSDLAWILVIVGGLVLITYSFVKDEIRFRRERQSLKQMEKNPWDPVQMTRTLSSNPDLLRHMPAARRAELGQLAQRLASQKDIGAVTQAMRAAFPDGVPEPGDMDDQLLAHPERIQKMFNVLAAARGEAAPTDEKIRDALAELQDRRQEEIERRAGPIPLTLRPKGANSEVRPRQVFGLFAVFLLLFVAFLVAPIYRHHSVGAALLVVAAIGLGALYFVRRSLYLRHGTLFVDELRAGYTTALARQKAVDRSEIGSVHLSKQVVISYRGATTVHRRMFVVGKDERPLLRLDGTYWSMDDMQTFAATLGVPLRGTWMFDETGDELRRRLPGSISWWAAHPNIFWVIVLTPLIGAFVVLIVALNS